MALFGFNKQKVLATAEKYVQQGKIQNAISEYEKVLKNDAKDLTVTNTVGDLYSRLGETDKATGCFKTVGDAYASQGFTVKAIAMYKKICKLQPSLESLLKLAELYSQQGLFNDARAQYLQVAEEFLKSGELENSVRIFQKILEMDPENSTMRIQLADVYVRLGKKTGSVANFLRRRRKPALQGIAQRRRRSSAAHAAPSIRPTPTRCSCRASTCSSRATLPAQSPLCKKFPTSIRIPMACAIC